MNISPSMNRIHLLALLALCMLGAGCASQAPSKHVRMQYDKPENCDHASLAAPPCFYQLTTDGKSLAYVQGVNVTSDTSTVHVILHDIQSSSTMEYAIPRQNHLWLSMGVANRSQTVYVAEAFASTGTDPMLGRMFSLNKINLQDQTSQKIGTWSGGLLDVSVPNNEMILMTIATSTHEQKISLMDLSGAVLKTLYQGIWSMKDQKAQNIIVSSGAIINPSGSKVLIESINEGRQPADWKEHTLFDLRTGEKLNLDTLPDSERAYGWEDDATLLVHDDKGATSTFSINE